MTSGQLDRPDPPDRTRPFVVVEADDAHCDAVRVALIRFGWRVTSKPDLTDRRGVWEITVRTADDASRAMLAALDGAGLLIRARAAHRDVIDRLCDDLRRLGSVDHHSAGTPLPRLALIDDDQLELLRLLSAGLTLGRAARQLSVSPRTADRRLADARTRLGVGTTAEAIRLVRAQRLL